MEMVQGPGGHDEVAAEAPQPVAARVHRIGPGGAPETRRPAGKAPVDARWTAMFRQIEAVLRLALGERPASAADALAPRNGGRLPAAGADAVAALSELHTALLKELEQRRQLEVELRAVRAALAQEHAQRVDAEAVERQARHLALHDSLTSLPNRSYFRERLHNGLAPEVARPRTLALLYLDLDGFKAINDAHGHAVGDELLRIVAVRLRLSIRAGDMVSRVGGDEFACLPADPLDRKQLAELALKLFSTVSAPMKIGCQEFTVRPSIGIAVCPADGDSVDALICSADAAMYRAKRLQTRVEFFGRHPGA